MTMDIAVREGQALEVLAPSPVFRGAAMVKALTEYRELQKALDGSMPDQLMDIKGRMFRKKGYWRAISVAFNLSVKPTTPDGQERSVVGVLEDGSENYVYSVTYEATAPNGRSATGDGTCAASEKQKGRMEATEHNVRSHAHTRAFNRAVSNLVAFGEVSAEEVERDETGTADVVAKIVRADGSVLVEKVETQTGSNAQGRPWTKFQITFDNGQSYSTFSAAVAKLAEQAKADGELVIPTLEQKGQYTNLIGLKSAGPTTGGGTTSDSSPTTTGSTNGERDALISDADRKKFMGVVNTQKWTEEELRAFLVKHECLNEQGQPGTGSIKRADLDALLNLVKMNQKVAAE